MVVLVSYERRFSSLRGEVDMATVLLGAQINASVVRLEGVRLGSPHHFVAHRHHLTSTTLSIYLSGSEPTTCYNEQSQLDV